MTLTITLEPESEARFRDDAARLGISLEQLTTQRLLEADLLWRIRIATPEHETRQLHRLLRRRKAGTLNDEEQTHLQALLDEREQRGALRLQDLGLLSQLRAIPVSQLMEQLGIHPVAAL